MTIAPSRRLGRVAAAGNGRRPVRRSASSRRMAWLGVLFVAPFMILFLAFRFIPYVLSILLSLSDYTLRGDTSWVGLDQYRRLAEDEVFHSALKITAIYSLIAVPMIVLLALGMALLSQRMIKGIKFYRVLFFLPSITSFVMSGIIFKWLYHTEGPINSLLGVFGIPAVPWLQSEVSVLPAIAILMAWTRFGFDMLIILAGLNEIPEDLYEAATVDGANKRQQFFSITLPLMRPVLFFVILIETVGSFQMFDAVYIMTGGGPIRASYTLVYMVYDQAFTFFDFGYASAAGVVLLLICLVIAFVQRITVGRED